MAPLPAHPRAIIFDLDGTLVDAYAAIHESLGVVLGRSAGRRHSRRDAPDGRPRPRGARGGSRGSGERRRRRAAFPGALRDGRARVDAASPGCRASSRGVSSRGASGSRSPPTNRLASRGRFSSGSGIAGRFAFVAGPDDGFPPKPAPHMVFMALATLSASRRRTRSSWATCRSTSRRHGRPNSPSSHFRPAARREKSSKRAVRTSIVESLEELLPLPSGLVESRAMTNFDSTAGSSGQVRFFNPGPVWVRPQVMQALTGPMLSHRSQAFMDLYGRILEKLPKVFRTARTAHTLATSATGVWESALVSCVEGPVLSLSNGAFSGQVGRDGLAPRARDGRPEVRVGRSPSIADAVKKKLAEKKYAAVTVVHSETSTGVISDLAAIAKVVHENSDALVFADCRDVARRERASRRTRGASTSSSRARRRRSRCRPGSRSSPSPSARWPPRRRRSSGASTSTSSTSRRSRPKKQTPTTPCLPLLYALDVQLDHILAEGIENRWARHDAMRKAVEDWAAEDGFRVLRRGGRAFAHGHVPHSAGGRQCRGAEQDAQEHEVDDGLGLRKAEAHERAHRPHGRRRRRFRGGLPEGARGGHGSHRRRSGTTA